MSRRGSFCKGYIYIFHHFQYKGRFKQIIGFCSVKIWDGNTPVNEIGLIHVDHQKGFPHCQIQGLMKPQSNNVHTILMHTSIDSSLSRASKPA